MILIISSVEDATADFFESKLILQSIPYYRFNTELALTHSSHHFELSPNSNTDTIEIVQHNKAVRINDIRGIWYRRPLPPIVSTQLESPQSRKFAEEETSYYLRCLWKILEDRNWVSHPWSISWANTKLAQLIIAREIGLTIPATLVTTIPDDVLAFYDRHKGKVIVKPLKQSFLEYGENISATIFTNKVRKKDLQHLDQVGLATTFFQEEIKKKDEIRVTVFGNEVYAAKVDSQNDRAKKVDWRHISNQQTHWSAFTLPDSVAEKSIQIVKHFGLQFGAIDYARTCDDEYVFFEINPNGQWAWLEEELGLPMSQSLIKLLRQ